jgi:outer membrane protein OmpA-like peptidoglycan-associated protein
MVCLGFATRLVADDAPKNASGIAVPGTVPMDFSLRVNEVGFGNVSSVTSDGLLSAKGSAHADLSLHGGVRIWPTAYGEWLATASLFTGASTAVNLNGSAFAYPTTGGYRYKLNSMYGIGIAYSLDLGDAKGADGFGRRAALTVGIEGRSESLSAQAPGASFSESVFRPWLDISGKWFPESRFNARGIEPYVVFGVSAPLTQRRVGDAAYRDTVAGLGLVTGAPYGAVDASVLPKAHAPVFVASFGFGVRFGKVPARKVSAPPIPPPPADPVPEPPKAAVQDPNANRNAAADTSRKADFIYVDGLSVRFAFNSAKVAAEAKRDIHQWVERHRKVVDPKMMVLVGHADSTGGEAHNNRLSLQRAQAMSEALRAEGLDVSAVEVGAKGFREPLAENDTQAGRGVNRRAELFFKASSSFRVRTQNVQEGMPDFTKDPERGAKASAAEKAEAKQPLK